MKNYRSIEVKILGKDYKYKVDEPEDVINEILENIKSEVETYAKKPVEKKWIISFSYCF